MTPYLQFFAKEVVLREGSSSNTLYKAIVHVLREGSSSKEEEDDDDDEEETKAEVEEDDDDNYEDADDDVEDDNGAIGKQLMQNGLQSPDSGIHGDKSANELSLSA